MHIRICTQVRARVHTQTGRHPVRESDRYLYISRLFQTDILTSKFVDPTGWGNAGSKPFDCGGQLSGLSVSCPSGATGVDKVSRILG